MVPSFQAAVNAMEEELLDSMHAQQSSLLSTQPILDSAELTGYSLLGQHDGSQGCSGVALVGAQGSGQGLLASALAQKMVQKDRSGLLKSHRFSVRIWFTALVCFAFQDSFAFQGRLYSCAMQHRCSTLQDNFDGLHAACIIVSKSLLSFTALTSCLQHCQYVHFRSHRHWPLLRGAS